MGIYDTETGRTRQTPATVDQRYRTATPPNDLQRQAVISQLAPPQQTPAPAQGLPGAEPVATNNSRFARGGQVKQLPGSGGEMAENLARTGMSVASTAAGAFNPVTIGTNFAADKLRVKEEMPEFGGEFGDLTDQYGRRFEGTGGGLASNAVRYAGYGAMAGPIGAGVGALAGLVKGALSKNAPSAYTDFRSEDAAEAIGKAFEKFYGRPATEDEIRSAMVGQGWDEHGGDRWMGEKPLNYVLGQVKQNAATEQAQRAALMEQLSTAGNGAAASNTPDRVDAAVTAPVGAGATNAGPAADSSGWNTDGFAAPQTIAQGFRGQAPDGWDQKKWNDPNHQTPKYVWGRITQDADPNDVEQLLAAYPGAKFDGKDKVTGIPGLGPIDIYQGASVGQNKPQWHDINAAEGGGAPAAPQAAGAGVNVDGAGPQGYGELDSNTLDRLKAELERIIAGQPSRDALMAQLGTANG